MCNSMLGVALPLQSKPAHNEHVKLTLSGRISHTVAAVAHDLTPKHGQKISVPMPLLYVPIYFTERRFIVSEPFGDSSTTRNKPEYNWSAIGVGSEP